MAIVVNTSEASQRCEGPNVATAIVATQSQVQVVILPISALDHLFYIEKMKKILLSYVFILSFLSQAQTLCSEGVGHYTAGTQAEPEVVFGTTGNGLPIMAPQYVYTTIGQNTSSDSCFGQPCSHKISNTTNEDTLTTHLTYSLTDSVGNVSDLNCSLTQYWNGTNWQWLSESSLGREELKRANVRAYPNPSNGRFTI